MSFEELKQFIIKNLKIHKTVPMCWLYMFAELNNVDVNTIEDVLTELKRDGLVKLDVFDVYWLGGGAES